MRILQVHNYYRTSAPSGENKVVDAERELLRRNGQTVETFFRHNDDLEAMGLAGAIAGAAATAWNPFPARAIRQDIARFDPDIVHAHNTFPQISPSIFRAIEGRAGRVITLHNYRLVCPAGIPMREGEVCTQCIDQRSAMPSLRYGCYRDSRAATLPLAANVMLHRALGTWRGHVDAFIVFTEFQREMMVKSGLPRALVHLKPNFFPGDPATIPFADRPEQVLFLGRLTQEKGVHTLIEAWRQWGEAAPRLRVAGDGALRRALEQRASGLPIDFLGQLEPDAAVREIAQARLVVVPSEWFEGFPMVLQEAFALGTPAAVSDIGPLPSLIGHGAMGTTFEPKNPASLRRAVEQLWRDQTGLAAKALASRRAFEELYTEAANFERLMEIYQTAMQVKNERNTAA